MLEGSHFENIKIFIDDLDVDIIAIGETWLKKSLVNRIVSIDGYRIFRSDRNFKQTNVIKGGGGVCIFIRNELKAKCIEKSNGLPYTLIDYLILEITTSNSKLLFCNLYRHGDCPDSQTNALFHRIIELGVNYNDIIVAGDFNANAIDHNKFRKLTLLSNFMSVVNDNCPTYVAGNFNPSQLDLIFMKNLKSIKSFGHFPALGISNYQAIYCIINSFTTKREIKTYHIRSFNNIEKENVYLTNL